MTARDTPAARAFDAVMRPWWRPLRWLLFPATMALGLWLITKLPDSPVVTAEIKECDKQVAILLNTHDAVDLQRAAFIVRRLNCNIGDRLPQPHE